VDEDLFRLAFGTTRADINAIGRYLALPPLGRPDLSVYFDRAFYVALHGDGLGEGDDPLLHFLETGLAALLAPHPLIDLRYIVGRDPLILGEVPSVDGLMDLLEFDLADPSPYFDLEHYAGQLVLAASRGRPEGGLLRHFITSGARDGLAPNRWLEPRAYMRMYDDVPSDPYQAVRHFVVFGDNAGRDPGPNFDAGLYRRRYVDVADSQIAPLLHFLAFGRHEGRQATAEKPVPEVGPVRLLPVGQALAVDSETVLRADRDMRRRLAAARQQRKDDVRVRKPALMRAVDPLAEAGRLAFVPSMAPRVSILIPVFNEFDVTVECLMALQAAGLGAEVEIVVADDASTDPEVAVLADVPGLVVMRHAENLGFLRSCNAAFAQCRGEYVLLLNNDTQVQPGAVQALVAALDEDDGLGAVGPKLIYPNGRLQEAGCFVRPNGESGMIGLFADPDEGGYSRDRDVAYCSGAALMVRRSGVGAALFDEAYRPAYCEDTDLCLRLIAAGFRVRYVHAAVVVHHLSVSSNRDSMARKLRGIVANQHRLLDRWGGLIRRMDAVRVLAFYLPQFHPTPENDLWWGRGFTEWTNVTKAQPSYAGHYQPHLPTDLGYYDLRNAETLAAQASLAARYGVEGFVMYYYNFGSRRVLDRPLQVLRANPDIAMRFCLCWANENWTRHWDGGTREILLEQRYDSATIDSILADIVDHAGDPRAITVDGRPLFLVYRPLKLPDAKGFAALCRAAFTRAGFPGVHLVYVESMEAVDAGVRPEAMGFDASVEFPPHGRARAAIDSPDVIKEGWSGYRYDYPETVLGFLTRDSVPYVRYPAVFPSWDNTARQPSYGSSFDHASPEAFRIYVEEKIEEIRAFHTGERRMLFVNAWNEWAEGAHLEPDTGYGHRWLEALRAALDGKRVS
jgi:GT2 family glycosyltransferase